ncbi:MAG: hypothetical protein WC342_07825 [Methanoregula sp.]|jgi:hypothetical protein
MGNPYLNSGESIILTTDRVMVDDIEYDVILTSQRIALVDSAHANIQAQVIPFASVLSVKGQKTPAHEPVIVFTLVDPLGLRDSRTLSLVFSQEPYEDRGSECDIWVKKLIEYVVSARQEPVVPVKPAVPQKPEGLQPAVRRWVAPERPEPHVAAGARRVNRDAHELLNALQENPQTALPVPVHEAKSATQKPAEDSPVQQEPPVVAVPKKKPTKKPDIRKVSPMPEAPPPGPEKEKTKPGSEKKPADDMKNGRQKKSPHSRESQVKKHTTEIPETDARPTLEETNTKPQVPSSPTPESSEIREPVERQRDTETVQPVQDRPDTGETHRDNAPVNGGTDVPEESQPAGNIPAPANIPDDEPDSGENDITGTTTEKREKFWETAAKETFPDPHETGTGADPEQNDTPENQPEVREPPVRAGLPETVVFPVIGRGPEEPKRQPEKPGEAKSGDTAKTADESPGPEKPARENYALMGIAALIIIIAGACAVIIFSDMSGPVTPGPDMPGENATIPIVMATITQDPASSDTGVWIKVLYNGTFVGKYGNPGPANQHEVRSTGDTEYQIANPGTLIQATFKKMDYSGDCLTVEVYNNGTQMTSVSKCTPGGSVSILVDPNTGEIPYVPVTTENL